MGVRYDSDRSFSDRINMKWLHPRDVIDGLITAGMSGQAAWRDVWRTCLERRDAGRRHPSDFWEIAAIAFEVVVSVTGAVFYDL